jgi:hypothetical protein
MHAFENPEEEQLYQQTVNWLNNHPAIQQTLQQYNQHFVQSFIEDYAKHKVYLTNLKARYESILEEREQEWLEKAHECLEQIQQKKLFDLQCQWRAELITVPGVVISEEFDYWGQNIMNCPFLGPITKKELACYKRFLQTREQDEEFYDSWQNYDDMKEAYLSQQPNEYNPMPDWYEFHNAETGNGSLLLLPNLRGDKETLYRSAYFDEQRKAQNQAYNEEDQKPYLIPSEDHYSTIAEPFDQEMAQLLRMEDTYEDLAGSWRNEKTSEIISDLCEIGKWPIAASHDWIQALEKCHASFKSHMLLQFIDTAYAQYRMQCKMGLGFSGGTTPEMSYIGLIKEQILKGRALLGEPQNFDY